MVKFLNLVSWGGLYFCRKPNEIIELDDDTAVAREKLGLGRIIIDRSKKGPSKAELLATAPKPEAKAEPPKEA
jgi:hypothetical protein